MIPAMDVANDYARRLAVREAEVARLTKVHERIGSGRLALGAAVLVVAWAVLIERALAPLWLLVPIGAFVALVLYHSSVRRLRVSAERAADYYRHGIARIEDRWSGLGERGERFSATDHIYAADLDLFGAGSLFQLLSVARTRMGEDTLAGWLMAPAAPAALQERHAGIADLRVRLDLREEMAVLGEDSRVGVNPQSLLAWAEAPNQLSQSWLLGGSAPAARARYCCGAGVALQRIRDPVRPRRSRGVCRRLLREACFGRRDLRGPRAPSTT